MNKISIEILDAAAIDPQRLPKSFEVQFNPGEYSLAKSAQYAGETAPLRDSPELTYTGGQSGTLSLELLFDTTRSGAPGQPPGDVRKLTNLGYVQQLVRMQPQTHAPPRVIVTWGTGLTFTGYADSLQQKFTMFDPDGTPVRATASVSFKESLTADEHKEKFNLQSPDRTRTRVVRQGETLCGIAAEEFEDPAAWRHIARENADRIANPRKLAAGTVLRLPPWGRDERTA